jgi:hypothetical protein
VFHYKPSTRGIRSCLCEAAPPSPETNCAPHLTGSIRLLPVIRAAQSREVSITVREDTGARRFLDARVVVARARIALSQNHPQNLSPRYIPCMCFTHHHRVFKPATSRSKCKPVRRSGRFARPPSWPSHFRTSRAKAEGHWTESVLSNRRQTNTCLVQKGNLVLAGMQL